MASAGLTVDEQKAVEKFRKDIVEPSMTQLVILDFWAEWCGPCKALAPVLEKVASEYADKGVMLAKVNVDEDQFIASQFQVRSIPTVYAMFQGQPVADLTGARTESQLRQALDALLDKLPAEIGQGGDGKGGTADIAQFIELGEQVLAAGEGERAAGIFAQVTEMDPLSVPAHAGLIRAFVAAGNVAEAQAALAAVPVEIAQDPALEPARAAVALAADRPDDSELQAMRAAAAERPTDMEAQMAFAEGAFAAGSRDEAADTLLKMIEVEPEWNDGAAKAKLLQIFEVIGLEDPWVAQQRRRLSLILFG